VVAGKSGDIYNSLNDKGGSRFSIERLSSKTAFAMHDLASLSSQVIEIQQASLQKAKEVHEIENKMCVFHLGMYDVFTFVCLIGQSRMKKRNIKYPQRRYASV
jgi:hypothetical protein